MARRACAGNIAAASAQPVRTPQCTEPDPESSMKAAFILAAVAIACMLPGCSVIERMRGGHCSGHECKVIVSVDGDCRITADPETLHVPPVGSVSIRWKFDPHTVNFLFDNNGISFKANPGEFDEKRPEDGNQQFHWRDKNTLRNQTFRYTINLRDAQGRLCSLDPFIHNQ
jgi:hypothetical protein